MTYQFNEDQLAWLELMETTDKLQGRSALKNFEGKYCCLGLACELLAEKYNINVRTQGGFFIFDDRSHWLPAKIRDALNLRSDMGTLKHALPDDIPPHKWVFGLESLANMNDCGAYSFKDIAKYIREHPENVFKDASDSGDDKRTDSNSTPGH